jgi:hypothetical protein
MKRQGLRRAAACAALVSFSLAGRVRADEPKQSPIQIEHDPLACVTPKECPKVDAAVAPGQLMEKSYVFFKAANTEDFYYVLMAGPPAGLAGILPRPLPETPAIDYFLRAVDTDALSRKTPDYLPPVVPSEGVCKKKGVAVGPAGAGLTIGLTREGQDPIPPGFNKADIAKVILVSGAVVAVAEALKSTGAAGAEKKSNTKRNLLIAGGALLIGGGIAIAATNSGGSSSSSTPTVAATASPSATGPAPLSVTFSLSLTGGSPPFTFSWNFGDGTTSTAANPTHVYLVPGSYTASVTVTDSRGRSAMSNLAIQVTGPPPLAFYEADASWSGLGDIDLRIVDNSGSSVGQPFDIPCGPTENRSERVFLQGAALVPGAYSVTVKGNSCGPSTPTAITTIVNLETDQGSVASCANVLVVVGLGETKTACTFTVP